MKKQKPNRRLRWLIAILAGLGALAVILVIALDGQMAAQQEVEAQQRAASEAAAKSQQEASEGEQYIKCIENANKLYSKYMKDAPKDLTPDQYLAYAQPVKRSTPKILKESTTN